MGHHSEDDQQQMTGIPIIFLKSPEKESRNLTSPRNFQVTITPEATICLTYIQTTTTTFSPVRFPPQNQKIFQVQETEIHAGYWHKPTKSNVDLHANFTSSSKEVRGKGTCNIDKDNALVGLLTVNQEGSSWNSHGELAYLHKPTKSEVSIGVCNDNGDTNLILKGQTKILKDRNRHAMDGSILVKQQIGGTLVLNANLDYKHKPSDTHFTVGVMHHNNATMVNTGINTKIKNKASLDVSGCYNCTPESQSVVVQFSGNS